MLHEEHFGVVGINETWLESRNRHCLAEIHLPGYQLFSIERPNSTGRGGGSAMYVKDSLNPVERRKHAGMNCEVVCVQIQPRDRSILKLVLVYRNPHTLAAEDEELYSILQEILDGRYEAIIFGDFNLPYVDWATGTAQAPGNKLVDFAAQNALVQRVLEPTRGDHVLDLVLCTEGGLIQGNVEVGNNLGTSDHKTVSFVINKGSKYSGGGVRKPDFRRANFHRLRELAAAGPYFPEGVGASQEFTIFRTWLETLCEQCIPTRYVSRDAKSTKPLWWTPEVGQAISDRQRLHRTYKRDRTEENRVAHISACRRVKRLTRTAKRMKEIAVAAQAKTNTRAFYCYVNDRRVCRQPIGPLISPEGHPVTDNAGMATLLNEYFASVFTIEDTRNIPAIAGPQAEVRLDNVDFPPTKVEGTLSALDVHKSVGPDGIHNRVLKELSGQVSLVLARIFAKSMATGDVPVEWREANVTGIHKKGDRGDRGNYRPISLTSNVCKTMERMVRDCLVDYIETHGLIGDTQHGFRRRRSCLTNLVEFFSGVFKVYDETKAVDLIYLDFQKAFDKVPHERLLLKVAALGIHGDLLRWIRAWLTDRRQRVCIGQAASEWVPVTSGVPQGSVLGPVLFLIYINDIDAGLLSRVSKFADDTKLCSRVDGPDYRRQLQADVNRLLSWSEVWQMPFNTTKCTVMHLGCHNTHHAYTMDGSPITQVDLQRDLGVLISSDLKWDHQVDECYKRANKVLGMISRNFVYKSRDIILPLYKALVRPHLEYAVQFWAPTLRKHIIKLERIQHRATKLIPELRGLSYEDRCLRLGLITLEKRRLRGQLIETFKYLNGFNNAASDDFFPRDPNPRARLDNGRKLLPTWWRTQLVAQFFPVRIVQTWNALPSEVVQAPSVDAFKARLDRHWGD